MGLLLRKGIGSNRNAAQVPDDGALPTGVETLERRGEQGGPPAGPMG